MQRDGRSEIMKRGWTLSALLLVGHVGMAHADHEGLKPDDFPNRPIEMVVVYPAGGGMDATARTLARETEKLLPVNIVVVNRTGGAGLAGHTYLANQAPKDGYTIAMLGNPWLFTDILLRDAPFDPTAFRPINSLTFEPLYWVVNAESELADMGFEEIIAYAREHPGELRTGVMPDNNFEWLNDLVQSTFDVEFAYVPFESGGAMMPAILGGHIDIASVYLGEFGQYYEAGQIKPVFQAAQNPYALLPEPPTMEQVGIPFLGPIWGAWRMVMVPEGVPEDRVAYLEAAFMHALSQPETIDAFKQNHLLVEPIPGDEAQKMYTEGFGAMRQFFIDTGRIAE
jgi:tripartite-type tricarboxylate transporter receptor subunit TctC